MWQSQKKVKQHFLQHVYEFTFPPESCRFLISALKFGTWYILCGFASIAWCSEDFGILLRVVMHPCIPRMQEAEIGRMWVHGQLGLHSKFQFRLKNLARPCLKKTNKTYLSFSHDWLYSLERISGNIGILKCWESKTKMIMKCGPEEKNNWYLMCTALGFEVWGF